MWICKFRTIFFLHNPLYLCVVCFEIHVHVYVLRVYSFSINICLSDIQFNTTDIKQYCIKWHVFCVCYIEKQGDTLPSLYHVCHSLPFLYNRIPWCILEHFEFSFLQIHKMLVTNVLCMKKGNLFVSRWWLKVNSLYRCFPD